MDMLPMQRRKLRRYPFRRLRAMWRSEMLHVYLDGGIARKLKAIDVRDKTELYFLWLTSSCKSLWKFRFLLLLYLPPSAFASPFHFVVFLLLVALSLSMIDILSSSYCTSFLSPPVPTLFSRFAEGVQMVPQG